jgi:hypothetical protein
MLAGGKGFMVSPLKGIEYAENTNSFQEQEMVTTPG